jgi:hypothetical protein
MENAAEKKEKHYLQDMHLLCHLSPCAVTPSPSNTTRPMHYCLPSSLLGLLLLVTTILRGAICIEGESGGERGRAASRRIKGPLKEIEKREEAMTPDFRRGERRVECTSRERERELSLSDAITRFNQIGIKFWVCYLDHCQLMLKSSSDHCYFSTPTGSDNELLLLVHL